MKLLLRSWLVVLAIAAIAPQSQAQLPSLTQEKPQEAAKPETLDLEALAAERQEIAARLTAAQAAGGDELDAAADNSEELALLNRLALVLDRILKLAPRLAELRSEREEVGNELARIRASGRSSENPLTIRELDELRDQYELERDRTESTSSAIDTAQAAVEDARKGLTARERQRRLANEQLEAAKDAGEESVRRRALELAELQRRVARATLQLRRLESDEIEAQDQIHEGHLDLLEEKIDAAKDLTLLTKVELNEILQELAREKARLEGELSKAKGRIPYIESVWKSASERLAAQSSPTEREREEVEALLQNRETLRYLERALGERLTRNQERQQRWKDRLRVTEDTLNDDEYQTLIDDLEARRTDLRLEMTGALERLKPMRSELRALELRIEQGGEASELTQHLANQRRFLDQRISTYELNIASMEVLDRLIARLYVDLTGELGDELASTWQRFTVGAKSVWAYELTTVANETPITVRKIVLGLLIFILGFRFSRLFSRFLGNRLLPRFGLEASGAAVVRTLLFYALTLTFILFALNFVDVPLTAFTVLGGALAVGVGFGSQNIVNNFISGLIILVEQPVRVGDLIQIGDLFGNVVRIGARSTQIRTGSNVEIMVPNSSFLENNVVNLTLTDDMIRAHVEVGLAYGSPVREVVKLLKRAASEHGRVINSPEPFVLFESFGDNSLVFEVHFWIRARAVMDRRLIESDIRNRIDSLFRTASLVIAFPQRDVHFDTAGPIKIQMVEPDPVEDVEAAAKAD